ncbi:hypothetical protein [Helicobacter pullorum]|uniref:hypothetical protein n=1 Tax=Helicobacter pullorum TaxID=35818 RepID=UPI00241FD1C5|nr:hypothetical protein [Helicobacter pullorum]
MDNGVNLFGKMKGIHQERLRADSISEITTEIKKDISALDNNIRGYFISKCSFLKLSA